MSFLKNFLFVAGALSAITAFGQSKINSAGSMLISDFKAARLAGDMQQALSNCVEVYPAIIMANDRDAALTELEAMGLEVNTDLGDMFTVNLPIDKAEALAACDAIRYVDFGQKVSLMMNYARPASQVTDVQAGFSLDGKTLSFDGTGVVAGMYDTGLEGGHVNFKLDNGAGKSRLQRVFWYRGSNGSPTVYTSANISSFSTDTQTESHGTHVAGIMAGSYKGDGTYAYISSATGKSAVKKTDAIPYYGVAPGTDLAFSVGELYTANIMDGVERIVNYATEAGQPCVVNLSLGSTNGAHDGTGGYNAALSRLGEKAIICVAAGNDGDVPMSIVKELTESSPNIQTMIKDNTGSGIVDIWGADNSEFTVSWAIYSTATRKITKIATVTGAGESANITSSNNTGFGSAFTGSIRVSASVDALNNRYHVYTELSASPKSSTSTSKLALIVEGSAGQKVWIYGNSATAFANNSLVGWTAGSADNSINDACTAKNIISVGSYNTRNTWGVLQNNEAYAYQYSGTGFTVGSISPFSGYGTSFQGQDLPLVTAPGANIISSYNRYYVTKANATNSMTANVKVGISTDYWGPMQGTSMACPYASGVVALWLQACPTLTFDQVKATIDATSEFKALQMRPAIRWGAGKINALEGVKYVLKNYTSAIGGVVEDNENRLVVSPNGTGYDVMLAGEANFNVELVDLQGRRVALAEGLNGEASVSTEGLAQGIYVLSIKSASYSTARKVTVR
ncbi:MAG: S8 family peptidase [Firmicutes bacterium]|nr:S8 family peptidase [Bacillota bacterium]MCM1401696.1 S8 family peptidase [Bacteroides sp.]MCM1477504.1 S8 family peptidase [Bacteroides sp.]